MTHYLLHSALSIAVVTHIYCFWALLTRMYVAVNTQLTSVKYIVHTLQWPTHRRPALQQSRVLRNFL